MCHRTSRGNPSVRHRPAGGAAGLHRRGRSVLFYADNPTGATRSVNGLGRTVGIKRLSAYARSCRYRHDRAERDLRMSKVKQKVSGCFRTRKYAEAYCRISSYLQSMANQGYNPLVAIQIALAGRAVDNLPE